MGHPNHVSTEVQHYLMWWAGGPVNTFLIPTINYNTSIDNKCYILLNYSRILTSKLYGNNTSSVLKINLSISINIILVINHGMTSYLYSHLIIGSSVPILNEVVRRAECRMQII